MDPHFLFSTFIVLFMDFGGLILEQGRLPKSNIRAVQTERLPTLANSQDFGSRGVPMTSEVSWINGSFLPVFHFTVLFMDFGGLITEQPRLPKSNIRAVQTGKQIVDFRQATRLRKSRIP